MVYAEDCSKSSLPQGAERVSALFPAARCRESHGRQPELDKELSHEIGVSYADAITKGSHPCRVRDFLPDIVDHEMRPGVISREDPSSLQPIAFECAIARSAHFLS